MAKFWRSPAGKIIVSAAGKPIDCPDCACEPQPLTCDSGDCEGIELPYSTTIRFETADAGCEGFVTTFDVSRQLVDGGFTFAGYDYLWISDVVTISGVDLRILVTCSSVVIASADGLTVYGSGDFIVRCCCPFNSDGSFGITVGACATTLSFVIGPETVYLTLEGDGADCLGIAGVWPLTQLGLGSGWGYSGGPLDPFSGLFANLACDIAGLSFTASFGTTAPDPTTMCIIISEASVAKQCSPTFSASGTYVVTPDNISPWPCDCTGGTVNWSLAI